MYLLFIALPLVVAVYCLSQIYRDVERGSYGWAAFGAFALLILVLLAFHA